jgi:hypothetical protein
VPELSSLGELRLGLNSKAYEKDKDFFNSLLDGQSLAFDYSDLSYIIVESESDIDVIARSLTAKYAEDLKPAIINHISQTDRGRLLTYTQKSIGHSNNACLTWCSPSWPAWLWLYLGGAWLLTQLQGLVGNNSSAS